MRARIRKRRNSGLTLVEVMVSSTIFTMVMGALYTMSLGFSDVAEMQQSAFLNMDNTRYALLWAVPLLRQAVRQSINYDELPGESISFQIPLDSDGNGSSVNQAGKIELGPLYTIKRDLDDINGDGFTTNQLVLIIAGEEDRPQILANTLSSGSETVGDNGVFGPENDLNNNGQLDRGFWVQPQNGGLRIQIQSSQTSRLGHEYQSTVTEFVVPRN